LSSMKKLIVVIVACILSTALFAQANTDKKMHEMKHSGKMDKMEKGHMKMKDCVMMEEGKMMMMKNGETMSMDQDMTMKNGTMVMTDGTVKMKNGKTMMLKDGDCVYMNGSVSRMGGMKHSMKDKKM
jgi:hypothetical protein